MNNKWFYHDGSSDQGPFSLDTLRQMAQAGVIESDTLVRREDQTEAMQLSEAEDPPGAEVPAVEDATPQLQQSSGDDPAPASQATSSEQIYVAKNYQRHGPYSKSRVEELIAEKKLSSGDQYWQEGMAEWKSLNQGFHFTSEPPPLPKSRNDDIAQAFAQSQESRLEINWIPALVSYCIACFFLFLSELATFLDEIEAGELLAVISFIAYLPALVMITLLHYRCWKTLPENYRWTTPGKAVGFMFIPIYNFYWAFITWPKLVDGITRWQRDQGIQPSPDIHSFSYAYPAIFIAAWTIGFIPGFDLLVIVADVVVWILLYKHIVGALNQLVQARQA